MAACVALVLLAGGRVMMLRRQGINAFVFGATDKSDLLLVPGMLSFFYSVLACAFSLPLPNLLSNPFWRIDAIRWGGLGLCTASLIWFALTLKVFGKSFGVCFQQSFLSGLIIYIDIVILYLEVFNSYLKVFQIYTLYLYLRQTILL